MTNGGMLRPLDRVLVDLLTTVERVSGMNEEAVAQARDAVVKAREDALAIENMLIRHGGVEVLQHIVGPDET